MMITAIKCCDGSNKLTFGKGLSPAKAERVFRTGGEDLRGFVRKCEADPPKQEPPPPPPDQYTPPPSA